MLQITITSILPFEYLLVTEGKQVFLVANCSVNENNGKEED